MAELEKLGGVLERATRRSEAPILIVITGLGGVGKSSLALYWLHHIRDRFPDGQLYADLGGFRSAKARPIGQVLGGFLRALGIAPDRVPPSLEEQVALFRSVTVGRRLIVMLDNAVSAAQVRAFLPSSEKSLVLVTTRYRLSGLVVDGAHFIELRPLGRKAAVELLTRILGPERVREEAEAAGSLVDRCGRLPIAVCASAARLALRPHWSIRRLNRQLDEAQDRLAVLGGDIDTPIRAVFDVSYGALSAGEARVYRMLGLHPGPTFGTGVAAAAADIRTHDHIGDLRPWHLVTPSDEMLVDDGLDRSVRPSDEEDNVREVHRTSTPTWSGHGCGTGSMVGGVLGSFRSSIR